MAVTTVSASITPGNNAAPASATKTGTGKGTGKGSTFDSMLQVTGDSSTLSTNNENKQPDALQTLLAALNGGLSPLILGLPQQVQPVNNVMVAGDGEQSIPLTVGTQPLQFNLKNVPINNGDLATLLQKFGASPALMRVLLEQPQGELATSMTTHPEVLADLGKALSNVAQQVTEKPTLLIDPKMTDLMQSILTQVSQSQASTDDQAQNPKQQLPTLLGKLQATISTHIVEVVTSDTDKTAGEPNSQADLQQNSTVVGAPVQFPLQSLNHTVKAEPNVVFMQGDKLNTQLADLVVKRAALIETPGRQEFRIVLQPQGLGEIEVRIEAVGNQIFLHFMADNATSKGLLDSGMANLKNQLQAQGIQFNRIEVSTGTTDQGGVFSGLPQDRNSGQNFQGQQGNQSSAKRGGRSFSIDSNNEITWEEDNLDLEGIDVTA